MQSSPKQIEIFVEELPPQTYTETLHKIFPKAKSIDFEQGETSAIIYYDNQKQANFDYENLNYTKIDGQTIRLYFEIPNSPFTSHSTVVIHRLPQNISEASLHHLCSRFGTVIDVNITRQNASVIFADSHTAEIALKKLHHGHIEGTFITAEILNQDNTVSEFHDLPPHILIISGPSKFISKEFLCNSNKFNSSLIDVKPFLPNHSFLYFSHPDPISNMNSLSYLSLCKLYSNGPFNFIYPLWESCCAYLSLRNILLTRHFINALYDHFKSVARLVKIDIKRSNSSISVDDLVDDQKIQTIDKSVSNKLLENYNITLIFVTKQDRNRALYQNDRKPCPNFFG